jgi:hypothetical protein
LLERALLQKSSGHPLAAMLLFQEGLKRAEAGGKQALAVDAAPMLAIVSGSEQQLSWHQRTLAAAGGSTDPKTRAWTGSLLNNLTWPIHDAGKLPDTLSRFEQALD